MPAPEFFEKGERDPKTKDKRIPRYNVKSISRT